MIAAPPRAARNGSSAAITAPAARPTKHLVFDLETGNPPEADIQLAEQYVEAQSNIKDPVKVQENLAKQRAAIREKAGLLDSAPVALMGWVTEHERVMFHHTGAPWGKYKAPKKIKGAEDFELICAKDERGMLLNLRDWLNARAVVDRGPIEDRGTAREGQPSVLVAFNGRGFDVPHLRFAYLRHRLTAPMVLWPEARQGGVEVFDPMLSHLYDYSSWLRGDKYVKLEVVAASMGLPEHKSRLEGKDVPKFVAQGKFEDVALYNVLDLLKTYRIFLGQTNQGQDQ